uniref:Endonuclease/exonuclease/phosphatase domain-containing protein n=1 Tax=Trichogramma kaykai TaxID=54128 RepID=A0ABD2W5Y3_9HYME
MERVGEGMNGSFLIVQLNCQGASQVMHDLGGLVYEDGVDVLLLQEPWRYEERVCGLPGNMRVFESVNGKAAVVIVNQEWDVMLGGHGMSDIDVTVCKRMDDWDVKWMVRDDRGVSDHNPMYIRVSVLSVNGCGLEGRC